MNQADVTRLMTQLKFAIRAKPRNLKNINGPEGRLLKLRKTVSALFKYERIELFQNRADEARGYAEVLINNAMRYGDCHKVTMDQANYWLLEKQLVHKLFKVLVPRYENYNTSYTRMFASPREYPGIYYQRSVLELKGNPFPTLVTDRSQSRNLLHNILLEEARRDMRRESSEQQKVDNKPTADSK